MIGGNHPPLSYPLHTSANTKAAFICTKQHTLKLYTKDLHFGQSMSQPEERADRTRISSTGVVLSRKKMNFCSSPITKICR